MNKSDKIANEFLTALYSQGERQNRLTDEDYRRMEQIDQTNRDILLRRIASSAMYNKDKPGLTTTLSNKPTWQRQQNDRQRQQLQQELRQNLYRRQQIKDALARSKTRPFRDFSYSNFALRTLARKKGYGRRRTNKRRKNVRKRISQ